MKAFALIQMTDGQPNIDPQVTPYHGYVFCDRVGTWGAYLVSGTVVQLTAINALPGVVGICSVTESGGVRWAELDGTIAPAVRTRLNTWLSNRGYPAIPAGWTYRQVVVAVFKRLNDRFDVDAFDIADAE